MVMEIFIIFFIYTSFSEYLDIYIIYEKKKKKRPLLEIYINKFSKLFILLRLYIFIAYYLS